MGLVHSPEKRRRRSPSGRRGEGVRTGRGRRVERRLRGASGVGVGVVRLVELLSHSTTRATLESAGRLYVPRTRVGCCHVADRGHVSDGGGAARPPADQRGRARIRLHHFERAL